MVKSTLPEASPESAISEQPDPNCALCPRLAAFRADNRVAYPSFFNAPVPSFGGQQVELLVVGMAPGLKGANRTGRPFTGDHAGILLFGSLLRAGFARGEYHAEATDGLRLVNCRITNAVRCVPPVNLPEPAEVTICNRFLRAELATLPQLRIALALGVLAHAAVLKACGIPPSRIRFQHGKIHRLPDGLMLANSYHVSRYNTNTGRLTETMFGEVIAAIQRELLSEPE